MPSPILKFTQGTFEHIKSGTKVSASVKYPVLAYKRDFKGNKGAWKFIPTASQSKALQGKNKNGYYCSVVRARGIATTTKRDKARESGNVNPVSPEYRHTGDWVAGRDKKVHSIGYPSKPKTKQPAPKMRRTGTVIGQGAKGQRLKEQTVVVEKKLKEAKKLKAKAVKVKVQAEEAKTPEVKKRKAKEAKKIADKAQTVATQVVESPKATKAQKDAARGTKRAAKKTESSAVKVVKVAEKAIKKEKAPTKKKTTSKKGKGKKKSAASKAGI